MSSGSHNNHNRTTLEEVTQQLQSLHIERDRLREEVATLTQQLESERRRNSDLQSVPTATAEVVPDNSNATVAQRNSNEAADTETFVIPPLPYRLDSQRNRIYPGDRVRFSTPTRFNSTGGVIAYFTTHRVTVKDRTGRKISKDAHNLTLVRPGNNNE